MDRAPVPSGSDGHDREVAVLVVDDQPRFLRVAATVVERTPGFHVAGNAANGVEAIERVAAIHPDLVLMDIHMPVMDGIAAARQISADFADVVVVLCSSYDRADLPAEFAGSGAADYLHKEELSPARLTALWAAVGHPRR